MSDVTLKLDTPPEAIDPTEIQVPVDTARQLNPDQLVDAGKVVMFVGDGKQARPMTLPQIFQEMFAILGDVDKRLRALENPNERPSGLIVPN